MATLWHWITTRGLLRSSTIAARCSAGSGDRAVRSDSVPARTSTRCWGCRSTTSVHRRWPTSWYFGAEAGIFSRLMGCMCWPNSAIGCADSPASSGSQDAPLPPQDARIVHRLGRMLSRRRRIRRPNTDLTASPRSRAVQRDNTRAPCSGRGPRRQLLSCRRWSGLHGGHFVRIHRRPAADRSEWPAGAPQHPASRSSSRD